MLPSPPPPFRAPLLLLLLLTTSFASGSPHITEFMASNDGIVADEDGDFPDWIEIHNPTGRTISLDGYGLTDTNSRPFKWTFPDFTSTYHML